MLDCLTTCTDGPATNVGFVVIAIVQILSYLLKRKFKDQYVGVYRLLFIYFSTLLLSIVLLPIAGVDWKVAFAEAQVLANAQVFGHQVYKNTKGFFK